ncbi:bifunctional phosphoribosylaminoimidazolecarboxamide formyltransferase/IMP cyclohydrolase [Neolewinella lacunae]|uniref:Bifunctional purine biosynthesis protein PurH n=1 Tax=Neolewinella lacunae TaxID=1517758 RepID=A0A923T7R7_9BACT|nr:bifunctional phosphoribosylaminoimidazolecarboxamide formyltransferase/IMP cyclohydrolase [Neolewinella lacunae]MBC6993806.1 bifunctional phosphoribosylaminoimidazolecarboxamide formyltransferase/IMP cyclohydrolase [Neolewinella lacunae]MDN3635303.1 bifunctional phosphoribosylaminoimidazolecarboxamide formyltransferase/IMP cyclohydrolase [Neolewinella lacunae]
MTERKIKSAIVSVYHKDGLGPIIDALHRLGATLYSTGGTETFIRERGIEVIPVEELTGYPSILDGRVKTLHPKVHGGILARREPDHLGQLNQYEIPEIDLVIVDLYPFEETVANTEEEELIIEKIDIGGIALIRAAAKNYRDVVIVPSRDDYATLQKILDTNDGVTTLEDRRDLARRAFAVSSHYDTAIFSYFNEDGGMDALKLSETRATELRYGENPHQKASFYGRLEGMFTKLNGKELSYNNLVDIDAAVGIMGEFKDGKPAFVILKHTNACGVAVRPTQLEAWKAALAADTVSAFGGILITNRQVELSTAQEIDKLFYEVLLAPDFTDSALELLSKKKGRVLLQYHHLTQQSRSVKTLLNGYVAQDTDFSTETPADFTTVTERSPTAEEVADLVFANKCAKHLKSNTIALVKDNQMIAMGCGQTSRVDALKQAIVKAKAFGFATAGSVMASDAFFPFSDCIELAHEAGVTAVVQPGGSIRDEDSIAACNARGMAMVTTGVRHFKH